MASEDARAGGEAAAGAGGGEAGALAYVRGRLAGSLKVKEDVWQRFLDSEYRWAALAGRWVLLAGCSAPPRAAWAPCAAALPAAPTQRPLCTPCRSALLSFIEQPETARVLFYVEGKDLVAVSGGRRGRAGRPPAPPCGRPGLQQLFSF